MRQRIGLRGSIPAPAALTRFWIDSRRRGNSGGLSGHKAAGPHFLKNSLIACEDGIAHFHPPLEGEGRAPQVRGVGCSAAQGVAARLRALSPHPAALRAATFPLQGKVIERAGIMGLTRAAAPMVKRVLTSPNLCYGGRQCGGRPRS